MIAIRPASERGYANHGWCESWHSFSFAQYNDPEHVNWGPLRVINEDRVAAGQSFGARSQQDMEIVSYVLEGSLGHKDSMGNAESIFPGEIQRVSAGTGVTHSNFNYSGNGATRFLQFWIVPQRMGSKPAYSQKLFTSSDKRGQLRLVVSPDGNDGSIDINQDARIYAGLFDGDETAALPLSPKRLGYVHVVKGRAVINGMRLAPGDALRYRDEPLIRIDQGSAAEVLVLDLPAVG